MSGEGKRCKTCRYFAKFVSNWEGYTKGTTRGKCTRPDTFGILQENEYQTQPLVSLFSFSDPQDGVSYYVSENFGCRFHEGRPKGGRCDTGRKRETVAGDA